MHFPKWAIYNSSAGVGCLFLVGLIKPLLSLIGMGFVFV